MNNIEQIIKELFEIEPSLRAKEVELREIVSHLLLAKPDTKFDREFAAKLRVQLLSQKAQPTISPLWSLSRSLSLAGGIIAVVLLVVLVQPKGNSNFAFNQQFSSTRDEAFGPLSSGTSLEKGASGTYTISAPTAEAMPVPTSLADNASGDRVMMMQTASGKGAGTSVGVSTVSVVSSGTAVAGRPAMMVYPSYATEYHYVYKGADFTLDQAQGDVYKRKIGADADSVSDVTAQLKQFGLGLADLASFSNITLNNFEIAENKTNGYLINVNVGEGSISINPNYTKWPNLQKGYEPLSLKDFPAEATLITIAEKFIMEHGINRALYGTPIVQNNYQYQIMGEATMAPAGAGASSVSVSSEMMKSSAPMAPDTISVSSSPQATDMQSMPIYAPDVVSITFPLLIKGTPIYEDGGYPYGLQVSVSVRDGRVNSVYNLLSQNYDASSYKLVTDTKKVLVLLDQGGVDSYMPQDLQSRKVYIEVGTPEHILLHYYSYNGNQSQELFVPALRFPLTKNPTANMYYPSSIVIPLVEELLTQAPPNPVIMY